MSDKPNTRKELFLSAILSGDTSNLPEPQTREEEYLYAIAVNGGGGGGSVAYKILGAYDTEAELRADHPTGNDGDAYLVGDPSHVFVWLVDEEDWHDAGAFTAIAGPKGDTGDRGPRGYQGPKGDTGEQGIQGDKGDTGERGVDGEAGPTGRTATVQVGTVASGASPSIENVGTNNDAILNFVLPKGDKGDKGDDGEDGQDGKSFDIKGQYPSYAALVAAHPTGSAGEAYFVGTDNNPDLYIWLTDDATWYNNGKIAGVKGDKGDKGDAGFSPIASVSKSGDTATIVIRDETGQTTAQIKDGEKGDPGVGEPVFNGTQAQWDGLTLEQKLEYQTGMVVINDDYDDSEYVKTEDIGTAAAKDSTDRVSPNNTALVESQSVYSAINTALSSIYTPRGDIACAELTSDLLIAANVGNIYETTDSGTTTALFLQGAGVPISAGSNVGIINAGEGRILFNLMANAFDLTSYQKKDLTQAVEGATTVEGALGALSTNKTSKVSSATAGDIASLDANGNLVDSGISKDIIPSDASASNKLVTYTAIAVSSSDTITTLLSKVKENQIANVNTSVSAFNARGISISYLLGTLEKFSNGGLQFKGVAQDASNNMYDAVLWFNDATVIMANPDYSYIVARPTSSVISGSTAPITSGALYPVAITTPTPVSGVTGGDDLIYGFKSGKMVTIVLNGIIMANNITQNQSIFTNVPTAVGNKNIYFTVLDYENGKLAVMSIIGDSLAAAFQSDDKSAVHAGRYWGTVTYMTSD